MERINPQMKDIAIYGAGGFGREVACLINRINAVKPTWNLIGFFDDNESIRGTKNEYGVVLGTIETLNSWKGNLAVAVSVGSPKAMRDIIGKITKDVEYPNLVDPEVHIMDKNNFKLGKGNIFTVGCIISIAVKVGDFNTFNCNVDLGHDNEIGCFNSFMPNVNISGGVKIGNGNFFGVKSTILQYLKVGNNVTIAAGSVMLRNAKDGSLYIGVPAKKVEL